MVKERQFTSELLKINNEGWISLAVDVDYVC